MKRNLRMNQANTKKRQEHPKAPQLVGAREANTNPEIPRDQIRHNLEGENIDTHHPV